MIYNPYLVVIVTCAALFLLGMSAGLPVGYCWGRRWGLEDSADEAQLLAVLAPVALADGQTEPLRALDIRDPVDAMISQARLFG